MSFDPDIPNFQKDQDPLILLFYDKGVHDWR